LMDPCSQRGHGRIHRPRLWLARNSQAARAQSLLTNQAQKLGRSWMRRHLGDGPSSMRHRRKTR